MRCLPFFILLLVGTAAADPFVEHKERHLGPTGMYGVTSPTGITITKVEKGSPADGLITQGDVLTAAGGVAFNQNTRRQLAAAIDQAEITGSLTLTREDGTHVAITLPVLGAYSDSAPIHCAKTDAIIRRAADYILKTGDLGRKDLPIALLGLLATGEEDCIDYVKKEVHRAAWANPGLKLSLDTRNRSAWSWGYTALFLCEYYLLTQDQHVLPAIRTYAVALAEGRDAAGLWGHGMATRDLNHGQLHGRLDGYAVMNQSSLPCFIALLLAGKCGVSHPEIDAAIAQTGTFYESFIGRGTLPYGVHDPVPGEFNNNGMSGLAAVAFSLGGNQQGAAFFSRMSAASHHNLETGHTGHFFNQLWTGPGTNLAGPETTTAFFRETRWLHTLNRKWNGNFTYDGCDAEKGAFSYRSLSDAGSHLLNLCLGRRKLCITGRDADPSIWLKGHEVAETIALANLDMNAETNDELLAWMDHPMPPIRAEAVAALRSRPDAPTASIASMMDGGTRRQKLSAIRYLRAPCPPGLANTALASLTKILRNASEDPEIRTAAAMSLATHGKAALPAFDDILQLILIDKPGDPPGNLDAYLGHSLNAISRNPYADGLVTNTDTFYAAARKLLDHRRASGRVAGARLLTHMPRGHIPRVADLFTHVIADQDRGYHSYHHPAPQAEILSIMATNRIAGGLEAAFGIFDSPLGKHSFKAQMLMEVLPKYGAAAKPYLPRLKGQKITGSLAEPWAKMIQSIESAAGDSQLTPIRDIEPNP